MNGATIISSVADIQQSNIPHVLYTGFRPSAPQSKKYEGVALTLGHVLQVNNMLKTHQAITKQTAEALTICVIADKQGSLDYRTPEHTQLLEIYKQKYIEGLFSVLGERAYDDNMLIYEEKQLDDLVTKHSLEAANYFTLEDYLHHSVEKERKIQSNLAGMGTFAKILGSTLFQSGSMAAVNASLVSGGVDQMGTVHLYGNMLHNMKERGISLQHHEVSGITQEGMIMGLDGNIMSTSKGNYIDIEMSASEVEHKIQNSHERCKNSVTKEFGSVGDLQKQIKQFQENNKNLNYTDIQTKIKSSNTQVADRVRDNYDRLMGIL